MNAALSWSTVALQGRLLVEASAGTGKTWTMAALYVRLLLEGVQGEALTPEQMVVCTYTDAAAQELSQRLRTRVEEVLQLAQSGAVVSAHDPVHQWVVARWQANDAQRNADHRRLQAALAQMDRAPISTLHGLCHRILSEFPLESGLGFQALTLDDGRELKEHLARDMLRQIGSGTPPEDARALPEGCRTWEGLTKALGEVLQPGAIVEAPLSHQELRAMLPQAQRAQLQALATGQGYFDRVTAVVRKNAVAMWEFLEGGHVLPEIDAPLYAGSEGVKALKPPAVAILDDADFQRAMRPLSEAIERASNPNRAFWAHWWPKLRAAQNACIEELGKLSFDLLIERVRERVLLEGSSLPEALLKRWPVALVDEFQDTDGAQYALLNRWFRDAHGAPQGLLAMVGDPKQAIYSFRGGDIHAYLKASEHANATLALAENQRSSTAYVQACNAFFSAENAQLSSVSQRIAYTPVQPAGRADLKGLRDQGQAVSAPLVLHQHKEALPNSVMRPKAIDACADLVVQLLAPDRFSIGDKALEPGDIAVLLVSNAEVASLRNALMKRGVPCVGQAKQTVFNSEWSRDLLLLLYAAHHPSDAGALRAALLTRALGVRKTRLKNVESDPALDAWRDVFLSWHRVWQQQGVLAAVLAIIEHCRTSLCALKDGERALTDLRHLGELLQEQTSAGLSADALLAWMREQQEDENAFASSERSLRLESDAKRVRLMTLHSSKGLEFPIVLLPTLWAHEHRSITRALGASNPCGERAALFENSALTALKQDQQDERFRLLYVALTRAVHACHVFTLPTERPATRGKSTRAKIDPDRSALDSMMERGSHHYFASASIECRTGWPEPPAKRYVQAPSVQISTDASAPLPTRFLLPGRYSFSTLSGGSERVHVEPHAADDERTVASASEALIEGANEDAITEGSDATIRWIDEQLDVLAMVKGTGFGQAMHDLLERRDARLSFSEQRPLVQRALEENAVRINDKASLARVVYAVADMLDRSLHTPLPTGSDTPCTLASLPAHAQRAELSFCFRVNALSLSALRAACADHGDPHLVPESPISVLNGMMTGAIDLVFEHDGRVHVLDYKTNALVNAQAYRPEALDAAMDTHHYRFQAFLYTVATHRYLRDRIGASYEAATHLGPAIYIFLRAAGLAPGLGLWSHRFPPTLVEAADRLFAGDSE